jgi:hypothetical protein
MTSQNSFSDKGRTSKTSKGGLAPLSQTVVSLLKNPGLAKPARKMPSAKSHATK